MGAIAYAPYGLKPIGGKKPRTIRAQFAAAQAGAIAEGDLILWTGGTGAELNTATYPATIIGVSAHYYPATTIAGKLIEMWDPMDTLFEIQGRQVWSTWASAYAVAGKAFGFYGQTATVSATTGKRACALDYTVAGAAYPCIIQYPADRPNNAYGDGTGYPIFVVRLNPKSVYMHITGGAN
jgi:hypothetical protein